MCYQQLTRKWCNVMSTCVMLRSVVGGNILVPLIITTNHYHKFYFGHVQDVTEIPHREINFYGEDLWREIKVQATQRELLDEENLKFTVIMNILECIGVRTWRMFKYQTAARFVEKSKTRVKISRFNCCAFIHLNGWHEKIATTTKGSSLILHFPTSFATHIGGSRKNVFNGFKFNWMCKQKMKILHFPLVCSVFAHENVLFQP